MESESRIVIRPLPSVFDGYKEQKYESHVEISGENPSLEKLLPQGAKVYLTERVIYPDEGGMLMKYKDIPYLRQGFVFPEALDAVSNVKKITVLFLAFIKGKGIRGRIGNGLAHYVWIADWMFQWYDPNLKQISTIYLQENRYRQSIRELIKFINNFIGFLGIKVEAPSTGKKNFGRVIGTLIEYDNAYYWRMEDIFSETNKELLLKNPKKELKRLLKIYEQREKQGIEFKVQAIVKLLSIIFWIPGVKRAFKKAIQSVDIEKMKITKDDSYFTMNYEGYNYQGKTLEQRQKIWLEMTEGKIPERFIIPPKN